MRFSVVVPVYNGEKYLLECLESVQMQTYRNHELLVIDDGSSDGSGAIAERFAAEHIGVRVTCNENLGPFAARRLGLSLSRGEYVVFLDADDVLRVDALETISRCIDNTGADIVAFQFSRRRDFSTRDGLNYLANGFYGDANYRQFKRVVCAGLSNSLWGKAIRLRCIDMSVFHGMRSRLMLAEDLLQLLPVTDAAHSFACIEEVLYFYRPNEGGSTASFKHGYISNTEFVASNLLEYGERWGMLDEATDGVFRLYVNLSKMLADSIQDLGMEAARSELAEASASLAGLMPDAGCKARRMRADQRVLLDALLASSLFRLWMVTEASHFGRRVLGHSI